MIFGIVKKRVFYSGDFNSLPDIVTIYGNGDLRLEHVYIDFSINHSPVHLSEINLLGRIIKGFPGIPIHLMHLDDDIEVYQEELKKVIEYNNNIIIGE